MKLIQEPNIAHPSQIIRQLAGIPAKVREHLAGHKDDWKWLVIISRSVLLLGGIGGPSNRGRSGGASGGLARGVGAG